MSQQIIKPCPACEGTNCYRIGETCVCISCRDCGLDGPAALAYSGRCPVALWNAMPRRSEFYAELNTVLVAGFPDDICGALMDLAHKYAPPEDPK